jgi:hypothetical protein
MKKRVCLILTLALLAPACGGPTTGKNIGKTANGSVAAAVYEVGVDIANLATSAGAVATGVAANLP